MNRHLHIVCLAAPWPADYGGAIDMLFKIKAICQTGVKIHLHYFTFDPLSNPNELNQYCETIRAYKRKKGVKGLSFNLPYIVSSRINNKLIENLNKDDYPVLLEGIHCSGIIPQLNKIKKTVVRLHNDECAYYRNLGKSTKHLIKKIYYRIESSMLKKYQLNLKQHCYYACITEKDTATFKKKYGLKNTFFSPVFTPFKEINSTEGHGSFCLYHGNLSVPENEKAALWLLENVFSKIKIPFVIAGKNPTDHLDKMVQLCRHACLVTNPSDAEINDLIKKAHINVLPSFNTTGIKIKLLHALFEGRHCVVNNNMITGTGLEAACHIGTSSNSFCSIITKLQQQPFTAKDISLRKKILGDILDTVKNAEKLIQYLW